MLVYSYLSGHSHCLVCRFDLRFTSVQTGVGRKAEVVSLNIGKAEAHSPGWLGNLRPKSN